MEGIVFSGLASANAVLSDTEKELGCALIDIGAGTTDVCVYADSSIMHTSVIPLGAKNVTSDIAAGLRLSLPSAEKIKLFLSNEENDDKTPHLGTKRIKIDKFSDEIPVSSLNLEEKITSVSRKIIMEGIIRPRIEEMAEFINNELYKNELKSQIPAGLIITGGGALTPYLREILSKMLDLPIRIGYPRELEGISDELKSPASSSLVGALSYTATEVEDRRMPSLPNFGKLWKNVEIKDLSSKLMHFLSSFIPKNK